MSKKFNFLENIFKLSETKNKEELPNEWEFIIRHEDMDKSKICVCNCKIKNYSIFINKTNKHFIYCGDCCRKQLRLKCSNENVIFRLFNHEKTIYTKQQYEIIKDIYKYSQDVIDNLINRLDNIKYNRLHKMKDLIDYMITNKADIILDNRTSYTLINLSKKIKWYEIKLEEQKQIEEEKKRKEELMKIYEEQQRKITEERIRIYKEQNKTLIEESLKKNEEQKKIFEEQTKAIEEQKRIFEEQKRNILGENYEKKTNEEINKILFIKYNSYLSNILKEHEYIKQSKLKQLYKFSDQFKKKEKGLLKIEKIFNTHYNKFMLSFDIKHYVSWAQPNFLDEQYCFDYIKNSFILRKYNKQLYTFDKLMDIRNILYYECKGIIETFNNINNNK
jgi:hypothetical protein